MRLALCFSREELNELQFPVLVEMWDKVVPAISASSSKRRRYLAEFSEAERRLLKVWYRTFYRWYLVTGTPESKMMKATTFALLRRAINFFASV